MKRVVFLIALALMVPGLALAGVNETFESYADNAAWTAASYGGALITGEADFQVVNSLVHDSVNGSDKCLKVTSAPGSAGGTLKFAFAPIASGSFSFNVFSFAPGGAPFNYAGWGAGGANPSLFHGMFYEYMNDAYYQYGNVEPYGGFEQKPVGNLSGGWHTVSGTWTANGRLSMWYDGVKQVDNAPMRDALGSGLSYISFWTPDGTGTAYYGSEVYIDNLLVETAAVPEPSAMLALGSGLVGMLGFSIRRRK